MSRFRDEVFAGRQALQLTARRSSRIDNAAVRARLPQARCLPPCGFSSTFTLTRAVTSPRTTPISDRKGSSGSRGSRRGRDFAVILPSPPPRPRAARRLISYSSGVIWALRPSSAPPPCHPTAHLRTVNFTILSRALSTRPTILNKPTALHEHHRANCVKYCNTTRSWLYAVGGGTGVLQPEELGTDYCVRPAPPYRALQRNKISRSR